MILLELLGEFVIDFIFIDLIGGALSYANNSVLKARGIVTRSVSEVKLDKLRKRYLHKTVKFKKDIDEVTKSTEGIVLEIIDLDNVYVEVKGKNGEIIQTSLKNILLKK